MDAPKRIWAWVYADPWGNELRWFEWEDHTPQAGEFEYILATEHERLLSEARNKALEDAAQMLLRKFPSMGLIEDFAAAIRAMKGAQE